MLNGIYANHKKSIIYSFIAIFLISIIFFCYKSYKHDDIVKLMKDIIPNIITFISICFGFYLTSLSILFSSKYIKTLNGEDSEQPTQRKIHTVKEYFKYSIYCALLTIALCFIVIFATFVCENIYILIVVLSALVGIFIENFIFIYYLLKIFMNALIIQARPDIEDS